MKNLPSNELQTPLEMNTVNENNEDIRPSAPPTYEQATSTSQPIGLSPQHIGFNVTDGSPAPNIAQQNTSLPSAQQSVIVIQQTNFLPEILGSESTFVLCPACHVQKGTRVEYIANPAAHLTALLLCIMGFWCCALLPYCCEACMNAKHYCGNCNQYLGTYSICQRRM